MNTADALDKTANAADGMREYTENDCLWLRLAGEKLSVVLYGTGNGADKILDACIKYGIKISGVFAGDGFVRNRAQLLTYSQNSSSMLGYRVRLPALELSL